MELSRPQKRGKRGFKYRKDRTIENLWATTDENGRKIRRREYSIPGQRGPKKRYNKKR